LQAIKYVKNIKKQQEISAKTKSRANKSRITD